MYKRNFYLNKIKPFIDKPVIKVIIGMRRVGKSVFLKQLINLLKEKGITKQNILYINMESLDFDFINDHKDLHDYFQRRFKKTNGKKYLLIDEVQEIKNWEKAVNSFLTKGETDIYITGSNSTILSSELSTLISGRYTKFEIYPLSFSEFLIFRNKKKKGLKQEFKKYLKYGGLPAIHYFDLIDEQVFQYIDSIYDTILLKDIIRKNNVRNVTLLENIYKYIFDNIGNIFSAKKVADYLKSQKLNVSVQTVHNYIEYLLQTFTAFKVRRYDIKGKRILELYEKYFAGDIGIRNSILGYKKNDISGLLENVVFLDLLRKGYKISIGKFADLEIDFIAEKHDKKIYFQVTYLLSTKKTVEREFGPLFKINDNYPKYVLSMDEIFPEDHKGIKRLNIMDFLLSENFN